MNHKNFITSVDGNIIGAILCKLIYIMYLQLNYSLFAGLPGRKNILPALNDRRARKSLSPKTDADDLNSFKSSS